MRMRGVGSWLNMGIPIGNHNTKIEGEEKRSQKKGQWWCCPRKKGREARKAKQEAFMEETVWRHNTDNIYSLAKSFFSYKADQAWCGTLPTAKPGWFFSLIKNQKESNPDALITLIVEVKESLAFKWTLYLSINCTRKLKRRFGFICDYLDTYWIKKSSFASLAVKYIRIMMDQSKYYFLISGSNHYI